MFDALCGNVFRDSVTILSFNDNHYINRVLLSVSITLTSSGKVNIGLVTQYLQYLDL